MRRIAASGKIFRQSVPLIALSLGAALLAQIGAAGSSPRTVLIIDPQHPPASSVVQSRLCTASPRCENGKDGIDGAELLSGRPPAAPELATVLTDTNCAPDGYGISHCLNELRLRDGSRVLVRHSHDMHVYPCLMPGETVRVTQPE